MTQRVWRGAFAGAFRKGYQARKEGNGKKACPYPDYRRRYHNGQTFSRSFIKAWMDGWEKADREERT